MTQPSKKDPAMSKPLDRLAKGLSDVLALTPSPPTHALRVVRKRTNSVMS